MSFAMPLSHRQQASEDFRGMSEGLVRALGIIKQAKDDQENRADKALARQIQQSQLAASQQQQDMGAIQLRGAKEEERLQGALNDFSTREATPGAFGPVTPEEAALPSPLSNRGRGEAFKDSIIAQLRTRRDPGNPVTPEQIAQERADKATTTQQQGKLIDLKLRGGEADIAASAAATARSQAEAAKTKKETDLLGQPKPPDPKDALERAKFARQLKQDFMGSQLTKDFQIIERTKDQMQGALASWKQRAQDATKEGKELSQGGIDQTLVTLFNKLLDPSSVVRESEYARTPEGMAFLDRLAGKWQQFQAGGAGITPEFRDELIASANNLVQAAESGFAKHAQDAMADAQSYGVDPARVVGGYTRYQDWKPADKGRIPGIPTAGGAPAAAPTDDDIIKSYRK